MASCIGGPVDEARVEMTVLPAVMMSFRGFKSAVAHCDATGGSGHVIVDPKVHSWPARSSSEGSIAAGPVMTSSVPINVLSIGHGWARTRPAGGLTTAGRHKPLASRTRALKNST